MKTLIPRILMLLAVCTPLLLEAQQIDTTLKMPATGVYPNKVIGYYRYLPSGYGRSSEKLPLIIFLHGHGEAQSINNGTTVITQPISVLLQPGTPPKMLQDGTKSMLSDFMVVSPQSPYTFWNPDFLAYFIDYLIDTYPKIDPERIYLTGLSMGGTGCWNFAVKYPEKIAALLPIASSGGYTFDCSKPELPVWSFYGEIDTYKAEISIIKTYNTACVRAIPAELKMIPTATHSSSLWGTVYATKSSVNLVPTGLTQDTIYKWMLKQRRTARVNIPPVANAGTDLSFLAPSDSLHLTGSGKDPDGIIVSYEWSQISGNPVKFENPFAPQTNVYGLSEGSYEFRLVVTDNERAQAEDYISVTVVRPQAIVYRINSGGIMVPDSMMNWQADYQLLPSLLLDPLSSNHTTGSAIYKGENLSDAPNNIFGNCRIDLPMLGPMMYNLPVKNGDYQVKLYFSSPLLEQSGDRVFNVHIEDIPVLKNFDITSEFGHAGNYRSFQVTVTDEMIDIDFERITGDPKVDGIEVLSDLTENLPAATMIEPGSSSGAYLSACPQPFATQTTFTFIPNVSGITTLTVKDLQGQTRETLFTQEATAWEVYKVDLYAAKLEEGIYIAELITADSVVQYRIMVTK